MPAPGNGSGSVTLAWDANTEPDLAGYKIYWGKSSRSYDDMVDIAKINFTASECIPYDPFHLKCCEITLTGFELGETYYFAATAYDEDDNESAYSEELSHTFTPDEKTLTTPDNFRKRDAN
jgi:hypothetical protein